MTSKRFSMQHAEEAVENIVATEAEARVAAHVKDYNHLAAEARAGTESEVKMSLSEGIKMYPKAIMFSVILSTAIVMEGYDTALMGSFFALPQFKEKFGERLADGTYELTAAWQAGLQNGAQCGQIIGLFINGIVSERIGYRWTMIVSLILMTVFIFIPFFAQNIETLLVGALFQGMPWGVFQTLTTAYASEVCPVALRAYLTTYVNLCWVFGQLIASGVLRSLLNREDQWAYRIPFAIQWVWPVPILIGCIFAPESPWWLVRHGKIDQAKAAVRKLTARAHTSETDVDNTIAMMTITNELEKEISAGTTYWDCFKGVDFRRTHIACGTWAIQNLCGNVLQGYAAYFLIQAGLPEEKAFDLSIGMYGIGVAGVLSAWILINYVGRRKLYLGGLIGIMFVLVIIGGLGCVDSENTSAQYGIGALLLIQTYIFDVTIGPVCYCLVAEISSTRLRAKTIVLARNFYNLIGIINSVIVPRMLNRTAWNWGAKSGFFWGGACLLCFIWTYFCLPEPKGRTYGELDLLFEQHVPARKFARTRVETAPPAEQLAGPNDSVHEKVGGY